MSHPRQLPKITVVTVCRNAAELLPRTIGSVLAQRYLDKEYIVVDGMSSDGTPALLSGYAAGALKIVREADRGIFDAMNKGIAAAQGSVICFLNAGDYYVDDEVLAFVGEWYAREGWLWAFGRARLQIQFREAPLAQKSAPYRRYKNFYLTQMCHQATFFHRELFAKVGTYQVAMDTVADWEFNLRAAQVADPHRTDRIVVSYDTTGFSSVPRLSTLRLKWKIVSRITTRWETAAYGGLIFYRWIRSAVGFVIKQGLSRFVYKKP